MTLAGPGTGPAGLLVQRKESIMPHMTMFRFKALPGNHPIYTGQVGLPLGELRYRKILADELGRERKYEAIPVVSRSVSREELVLAPVGNPF